MTRHERQTSQTYPQRNRHGTGGHYGFTAEELNFILNYDIKYRLGRDTESKEE